jgi:Fic family protein
LYCAHAQSVAYVEVIKRNGKEQFYLTKNFRFNANKWRKVRKYLGTKSPGRRAILAAVASLEAEALKKGFRPKSKFRHLDEADAEMLEDVRDAYSRWFGKLSSEERQSYGSDFLVRFTYNTNAIEGNRLSLRETAMIFTEGILPTGASTNDYNEALNSRDALKIIKMHRGGLGNRYILRLHGHLTKNTSCRLSGKYRDCGVRIMGSEWLPPPASEVPQEMTRLIRWYNNNRARLHPVEIGALLHMKLVQTHPFTDGNGRISRLLMNWVLSKHGYPMFYIENRDKANYYKAIEKADRGDLRAFVGYVASTLVKQFTFIKRP